MTASTPRFSMKKRFIAPVVVMATIPAAFALALPAQAASGGDGQQCEPAGPGAWEKSSLTEWQHNDPTPPVDPDNSSDESDPANLTMFLALTPVKHVTRQHVPAADGHWDDTTTTVYSWTGSHYPPPGPPVYADSGEQTIHPLWNPDNGNHNGVPHQRPARDPYQTGVGNEGDNASWFLRAGTWVKGTSEVPELSHIDYQWQEYTRSPAVQCDSGNPTDPTDPGDTTDPGDPTAPSVPTEVKGQTAHGPSSAPHAPNQLAQSQASNQPAKSHAPAANQPAVPLSIDAGL